MEIIEHQPQRVLDSVRSASSRSTISSASRSGFGVTASMTPDPALVPRSSRSTESQKAAGPPPGLHRDPRGALAEARFCYPRAQQRRLAAAGRSADDRYSLRVPQQVEQLATGDDAGSEASVSGVRSGG